VDVVEDGRTFEENATKKAVEIMKLTGEIVLADDSGIEIDFLNKEPGIYSARYLGKDTPYPEKNRIILERLEGVEEEKRSARFVCVIAAAYPNGDILTARGTIEGRIGYEIMGDNGFGYDPIFFVPEYNKTTAEMEVELKNAISHRGNALRKIKDLMKDTLV
jgi:XTP/dITP diphosphohydrolase